MKKAAYVIAMVLTMVELVFPKMVFGYQVADRFVLPMYGYNGNDDCLRWGGYNSLFPGKRHVADDFCASIEDKVKAPANGRVKFVYYDPLNIERPRDWYGLVVIEHTLISGDKVCSILGHCKAIAGITVGTEVQVDQYIADIIEYPPSSDHLHFGIYNGAYQTVEGDGSTIGTWCVGYILEANWPGNYLDPVQFVNNNSAIGQTSSAFVSDPMSQAFINAFNRHSPKIGWPVNYVHKWTSHFRLPSLSPGLSGRYER